MSFASIQRRIVTRRNRLIVRPMQASLALGVLAAAAQAQDTSWKDAANGNFSVADSWTNGAPGSTLSGNLTAINKPGNYTATLDSNNAVPAGTNGHVTDLTFDNAAGTLLITNNAALRYNAALGPAARPGILVSAGTLRLLNGRILQGVAGNKGIVSFGKVFGEGNSIFGADVTNNVGGEFRVVGQSGGPAADVTISGNIVNSGLATMESRALGAFNSANATLTLATLTNNNGATFNITGPGLRLYNGSITNNAGGTVSITSQTQMNYDSARYTNSGAFTLGGAFGQLDINGKPAAGNVAAAYPIFTQAAGELNAGGTNGIGVGATRFTGNTIRFNFDGGKITNGPIRLINSQLSFGAAPVAGGMFQIESPTQANAVAASPVSTDLLTNIPEGQTVSVVGFDNRAAVQLTKTGDLSVRGTLNFHNASSNADFVAIKINRVLPGDRPALFNYGTTNFGIGDGNSIVLRGTLDIVNRGAMNVKQDTRNPLSGYFWQDVAAAVLTVDKTKTLELSAGRFQLTNGTVTGGGTLKANDKTTLANAGKIKPGKEITLPGSLAVSASNFEPGVFTIDSDYEQLDQATLDIAIGSASLPGVTYSQLAITGDAVLGGLLQLSLLNGADPAVGDIFDVLTARSITLVSDPSQPPISLFNAPVFNGKTFALLPPVAGDPLNGVAAVLQVQVVAAVPEPGLFGLLYLGAFVMRRTR